MRHARLFTVGLSIALAWLAFHPAAFGHGSMGSDESGKLSALLERANLVFTGSVAEVEYRNSTPRERGEPSLPHTLVTYKIEDVLRGEAVDETLTLRFIGGSDGMGGFMDVSGVPLFQEGDQDVLFVTGNGEKGCPLVDCEWGRYRVYEYGVYNTKGSPVRALVDGMAVARGAGPPALLDFSYPAPKFENLIKNPLVREQLAQRREPMELLQKIYEAAAPARIDVGTEITAVSPGCDCDERAKDPSSPDDAAPMEEPQIGVGPIALEEFVGNVRKIARSVERRPVTIKSVDRDAPIYLEPVRQLKPSEPPADDIQLEEDEELMMLREKDFNPVLPKREQ